MKTRFLIIALGVAMVAIPAATPASQPVVKFAELQQEVELTPVPLDLGRLLLDPYEAGEFSIALPDGFTALHAAARSKV
jgi:hypothetical protein